MSRFLFLILLCIQYNLVFVWGEIRCSTRERDALLAFKRGLKDDSDVLSSWGSEDDKKECCDWDGVRCSNTTGYVIGLQISYTGSGLIRGQISPSLIDLHHLSYLDLTYIDLGRKQIPKFMGSIKTLQKLTLHNCNLSGIKHQQLGNLTNLVTLDLSWNSLRFENLSWLSQLSSLSYLDLSQNEIPDVNWPQQFLGLSSLKELLLWQCQLSDGTPPKDMLRISSSTSLSTVVLRYNNLTLATLDWLFKVRSLIDIDLSLNQLDGLIPDSMKNLTYLEQLDLSYNKLKGGVPKSLGFLSHLKYLDLSYNDLSEPLLEFIGKLSCKELEYLYLKDNQLSGPMSKFSSCLTLRVLVLANNKLTGFPPSFTGLSNLELLDVSNNSLEGTISDTTFKELDNLKELYLSFNAALHISPYWNPPFLLKTLFLKYLKLGPNFPTWLQNQRNLSVLDLSYTGISDEAPLWLWNFSRTLSFLQLSHNEISGSIHDIYSIGSDLSNSAPYSNVPSSSSPAPSLLNYVSFNLSRRGIRVLQLSQNKFSGPITSICRMHNLTVLDISYNQFSGELPACWKSVTELIVLNLAGNNFSSKIPHSMGFLRNLLALQLNDNNFSGELPSTLMNCQYIYLLDVGGNKLTGGIPKWIGSAYTYLRYLQICQNGFHGNIPQEICNLTQIQVLDISRNNLSGNVPRCINNFTSLVQVVTNVASGILSLSLDIRLDVFAKYPPRYEVYAYVSIQWKMKESEFQNNLGLLTLIDLSSNKLIGYIPRELFDLRGLRSLDLSRNSFQGSIPSNIENMGTLESLDLSRNHISGAIPVGLSQLSFLSTLDLSYNNLSGKIPTGTQLQSFDKSTYMGNALLCGEPLPLCLRDKINPPDSNIRGKDKERMNVFMSLSFMQDLCISMAFGFIFGFWGVIGSLIVKRSWRIAYFDFFSSIGDWIYLKIGTFSAEFRPR